MKMMIHDDCGCNDDIKRELMAPNGDKQDHNTVVYFLHLRIIKITRRSTKRSMKRSMKITII